VRTVAPDLRARQCLVMTRRAAELALRISRGDSLKKLVLASGDASPAQAA
jgi:hypothetical protein